MVQTWSLNYKKKASKNYTVFIHTLYYPRIKKQKQTKNLIYNITVDCKWKISFLIITNHAPTRTQNNAHRK